MVAPGVAYQDTILKFHTAHVLEHENAVNCVMEGNPLHEAQIEIVRKIGEIYAVNVAIDDKRRLGKVTFGAIESSHLEAVEFMKRYAEVDVTVPSALSSPPLAVIRLIRPIIKQLKEW